jgi:hypothetical protein
MDVYTTLFAVLTGTPSLTSLTSHCRGLLDHTTVMPSKPIPVPDVTARKILVPIRASWAESDD